MENKSTKYYSDIQEKRIANLLNWKQVSGSGSRPTYPGDVISEEFLGECKTHTSISDNIIFKLDHWNKIKNEAMSQFKSPVLFVDDGSQLIENTWCIFDRQPVGDYITAELPILSHKSIRLNKKHITDICMDIMNNDWNPYIVFKVHDWNAYLCSLPDFSHFFGD